MGCRSAISRRGLQLLLLCCAGLLSARLAAAEVFFKETFDDEWRPRWHKSLWKVADDQAGEFELALGKCYGDAMEDRGIRTNLDRRHYAYYSELNETLDTTGKTLVVQFSVKHEQGLQSDCGGGYIKLLPASSARYMKDFGSHTPYSIMFGPDVCGIHDHKTHVILHYKGYNRQLPKDKQIPARVDQVTHVYTLVIKPDSTYEVYIDLQQVAGGSLEQDLNMLRPKTIPDPTAKKPKDWDDRETIPDKTHRKPKGWDDVLPTMPDPDAVKPDDWDDKELGPWDPPEVPNPDYKGPWVRRQIPNPNYKGPWEAPVIPNPDYEADPNLYAFKDLKYVGFEILQAKAGSIFDNVMITDDLETARQFALDTWGKSKAAEKAMFDEWRVLELQRKADEEVKLKLQEEEFIRHQAETVRELQAEAEAATYRHVQRPQRAAKAEL